MPRRKTAAKRQLKQQMGGGRRAAAISADARRETLASLPAESDRQISSPVGLPSRWTSG